MNDGHSPMKLIFENDLGEKLFLRTIGEDLTEKLDQPELLLAAEALDFDMELVRMSREEVMLLANSLITWLEETNEGV